MRLYKQRDEELKKLLQDVENTIATSIEGSGIGPMDEGDVGVNRCGDDEDQAN